MTRKSDAIEMLDTFLRAGKSVCPYAKKAALHYAMDNEALGPLLMAIGRSEAGVVIASRAIEDYPGTKRWAQDTVLTMFVALTKLSYPTYSHRQAREHVQRQVEPVLRNDADSRRPYLSVRGRPLIAVCMAPMYPLHHPRFSPLPMLVLTWLDDINGIEIPSVREAMTREHGHVYDALELVLPLPDGELGDQRAPATA